MTMTLQKMQGDIDTILNIVKSKGILGRYNHSDIPEGVEKEEEFEDFPVADDQVYIGKGNTISLALFFKADDEIGFRKRAVALSEAIWPDGLHLYSLSGTSKDPQDAGGNPRKRKKPSPYKAIEPFREDALKVLLRQMYWGEDSVPRHIVTSERVHTFLTEYPSDARRSLKKGTEEWETREKRPRNRNKSKQSGAEVEVLIKEAPDPLAQYNAITVEQEELSDLSDD